MKRKITLILSLVLIVTAIGATTVLADGNGAQGEKSAIESMFDAMRSWSQQAQEKGEITGEEAKKLDDHFKDMEKYHEESGLGHCGGSDNDNGDMENQNYKPGYGSGMMRNLSGNSL